MIKKNFKPTVGIIGLGYVGLPLARLITKSNFNIFGFDIDKIKIKKIKNKISYIKSFGKNDLLSLNTHGNFFSDFKNIKNCDVIIICVPTPLKNNLPDLSYIKTTVRSIYKYLKYNQTLILESTSYPGTTRELVVNEINKKFLVGQNFYVGFSPERINPGVNEKKLNLTPKIVSGYSKNCSNRIKKFYKNFFKKIVVAPNLESAEFSKLIENVFRSVNIGFVNEMKFLADKLNLDIFEILKLAETKPFGFSRFDPGPGVGGHCIPIDPIYLSWKAQKIGIKTNFINLASKTNLNVIKFIENKINIILKKLKKNKFNLNILILGIAYKKNVDDFRESASIKLINLLKKKNYKKININDPYFYKKKIKNLNFKKQNYILSKKNLKKIDLTILMTDHDCYNYRIIKKYSKYIIDCRGRYKLSKQILRG